MKNPIQAAVEPRRAAAVDRAEIHAKAYIANVREDLEAANWNIDAIAPRPNAQMGLDLR